MISAMAYRYFPLCFAILVVFVSCTAEKPVEQKKHAPVVIQKPKLPVLSPEQRRELQFPAGLIENIEDAAGAKAEPFFSTVVMQSANLKG